MAENTPMMRQYNEIKAQNPDCILFFRLGDFYEMFNDDARLVSGLLDLTLTTRDRGIENEDERTPMCGVPYHSAEAYIARLIEKGLKVAICEQTEDPAKAKGLVKRDVVRIITPGTVLEPSLLDEGRNNFISAVYMDSSCAGVCTADISTGEVHATQAQGEDLTQALLCELGRFAPREAILSDAAMNDGRIVQFLVERLGCLVQHGGEGRFREDFAASRAVAQFKAGNLKSLGLEGRPAALRAVGGLLSYISEISKTDALMVRELNVYDQARFMELDLTARRNLELTETLRGGEKRGSLLWVLDQTGCAMGSRLLRSWIEKPLTGAGDIMRRQYAVGELVDNVIARGELRGTLKGLPDMERLISRIVYGTANARDMRSLAAAAGRAPIALNWMEPFSGALLSELRDNMDALTDISSRLDSAIVDAPPFSIREGGFIREGYNAEVDSLRTTVRDARALVASMEARVKEETGIKTLKVGYNKVFGYYIEVSKSYYSQVPEHFIRKQTLAGCERYITQELKEMEAEILSAGDRLTALEAQLFEELRSWLTENSHRVQRTAAALAQADALCALAEAADKNNYCMPVVDYSDAIEITDGRHPVVERMLDGGLFVPNDTRLASAEPTAIITGPNMAGKSTYMRQVALIVLMAQIGSFVPAKAARIGVVDRVFTRIGASDDLAGGRSTFMVEMTEVADILRFATKRSLIILDEIGRGTSTFDGMSVARAVLEHTHMKIGAKCLFATHYHELTDLEQQLPGVKNYNVSVKKRGGDIIFLRRIVPGGADDSYGVEVAGLAGLPDAVITRAKAILKDLEAGAPVRAASRRQKTLEAKDAQMSMGSMAADEIRQRLKSLDVNTLTPIEALNVLFELGKRAREG